MTISGSSALASSIRITTPMATGTVGTSVAHSPLALTPLSQAIGMVEHKRIRGQRYHTILLWYLFYFSLVSAFMMQELPESLSKSTKL